MSKPDIRSAEQAKVYASELRAILVATGVSDAKMEEGSMRVDANVSVHRPDEPFGTRCEIKNLNSMRSLGRAIDYEARRQVDLISSGERVVQQTRHWNEDDGRTHTLRSKEEAEDYRYFPEPDLVPLQPTAESIAAIDASLPPLPADRRAALAETAGVDPTHEAVTIIVDRGLDTLAASAIDAGADAARTLTHIQHDLAVEGAEGIAPEDLAALITMETGGELTSSQAKQVLAEMAASHRPPAEIAAEAGFEAVDTSELEAIVDALIADNPDEWERFVGGEGKMQGFFVGQVMKQTQGQADGKIVNQILQSRKG